MITLNRAEAPVYHQPENLTLKEAESHYLNNGIPFYFINATRQDLIKFDVVFYAGKYHESTPGQSHLCAKMLLEGTKNLSSSELAEKIAQYGAQLTIESSYDRLTFSVATMNKYLKPVLGIVKDIILHSAFPDKEYQQQQKIFQEQLKVNYQKTSYLSNLHFKRLFFGEGHPYAEAITPDIISQLSLKDLSSFYEDFIKNKSFEIISCGKITTDIINVFEFELGRIDITSGATTQKELIPSPQQGIHHFVKTDAKQTSLRIGQKAIGKHHPDYYALRILNEVLGGYFGSRLMQVIREQKGYSYGIQSSLVSFDHADFMLIAGDIISEHKEDALNEIYHQIDLLKTTLVSEEELILVKNNLLGSLSNSLSSPFDLMEKFKQLHFSGLSYAWYKDYVHKIKSISCEELLETAQKYYHQDNMLTVTSGG